MRSLDAVTMLTLLLGCAGPSAFEVTPPPLLSPSVGSAGSWTLAADPPTHPERVLASTPNHPEDADSGAPLARLGVLCETGRARLTVALLLGARPDVWNDWPYAPPKTGGTRAYLEWLFSMDADAMLESLAEYPDYVESWVSWDEVLLQRLVWMRPERSGTTSYLMELRDRPATFLALLTEHDAVTVTLPFDGAPRRFVFALQDRAAMDSAVGVVLAACGRRRGLQPVP
jgi:hypothetical protein